MTLRRFLRCSIDDGDGDGVDDSDGDGVDGGDDDDGDGDADDDGDGEEDILVDKIQDENVHHDHQKGLVDLNDWPSKK